MCEVEAVVLAVYGEQVGDVDCSAEEFDGVVAAVGDVEVLDARAVADSVERESVVLYVAVGLGARLVEDDVAQDARVVGRVAAAVEEAWVDFSRALAPPAMGARPFRMRPPQ